MTESLEEQFVRFYTRDGKLFVLSSIRDYKVWRIWRSVEGEYWFGLDPLDYQNTLWFGLFQGAYERFLHFDIREIAHGNPVQIEDFIRSL